MSKLLYKDDFDEARDRLTAWWNGEDIGRPAMQITAPREPPWEEAPEMPPPPGWLTDYSTSDFAYRVHLSRTACLKRQFLAEAMPVVAPDLAPNCLALYLGCRGVDQPGTVWCEPCLDRPENAVFRRNPSNSYWDFTLRLGKEQLRLGRGKFLIQFPDLIEGLDTLAAMRGNEELLVDLIDRPDWVRAALSRITESYFECYDDLYDLFRDDRGGSFFWAWAPGRMAKLQCDFSAMISPEMFGKFMAPVLTAMTQRLDHCMYHWDGPGAIGHHDHLLSIPKLDMLQWTPGAGCEPVMDRRWWPLYHKTLDAGKAVFLHGFHGMDNLAALKKAFGKQFNRFMISTWAESRRQADEILALVSR